MAKNLRALVKVFHCPKRQIDGRVRIFEKGSVFAASELGSEDIRHLLRQKHIEETDDPQGPPPVPAATDALAQIEVKAAAPATLPAPAPAAAALPAAKVTKQAADAATDASVS
jgi:hypothetical protein